MNTTTNLNLAQDDGRDSEWTDGAPLAMPSEVVLIDLRTYRRLACAVCLKRGMKAVPQHDASGRYRVLCSCRTCRHVEAC
jgi:hypothetical protein